MERKYQLFISSTSRDLKEERNKIVEQILDSHHFPIGMEMFHAGEADKHEVIERTIESSDVYLLILGHRYGSSEKGGGLSYTEYEYEHAKKHQIPTLIYYLDDEQVFTNEIGKLNRSIADKTGNFQGAQQMLNLIYADYYDQDQGRIRDFRARVMDRTVNKEIKRKIHFDVRRNLVVKSEIVTSTHKAIEDTVAKIPDGGWIRYRQGLNDHSLKKRLISENGELFSMATLDNLEYARILPDTQSLKLEASFQELLKSIREEFCIATTAFKLFYDNERLIRDCLERGVRFRVLLVDPATETAGGLNQHLVYNADAKKGVLDRNKLVSDLENVLFLAESMKQQIEGGELKGSLDFRYFRRPLQCQMWLRDANSDDFGLAQINVANYNGFKAHFRFTPDTGLRMIRNLAQEFNHYWQDPLTTSAFS